MKGQMMYRKLRMMAAEIFDQIGSKHDEVADICTEGSWLCSWLDYAGAGELFAELWDLALELEEEGRGSQSEEEWRRTIISALHDPICNYFYDHGADMKRWGEYAADIEPWGEPPR